MYNLAASDGLQDSVDECKDASIDMGQIEAWNLLTGENWVGEKEDPRAESNIKGE